jgi:sec-independent protein translocase protein TatA
MGPVGVQEMVVIFLVALVLFGPKKLPELGKTIAKALGEFRRAQSDLKATFEREMKALEHENQALQEAAQQTAFDISKFSDFDLGFGTSGDGAETPLLTAATDGHGVESGATTTVSASAIPGAESHGSPVQTSTETSAVPSHTTEIAVIEAPATAVHAADGTVARGTVASVEKAAADARQNVQVLHEQPLHEQPAHETHAT